VGASSQSRAATAGDTRALLDAAARAIRDSTAAALWRAADARADAEELLDLATGTAHAARRTRLRLSAGPRRRFARLVARRAAGEPLALIRGHVDFRGLRLHVRPGTFAPRPSSEALAGAAIRRLQRRPRPVAVDVATGVGPVALSIAAEVPAARVVALDISARALVVARANRRRLGLGNAAFHRGDGLAPLPTTLEGAVHVITVHPPYVPRGEVRDLPVEVRGYEPASVLSDGSADGLGLLRRIVDDSPRWLAPGGWLLVEVSPDRSRRTSAVLRRGGFSAVRVLGRPPDVTRLVTGRLA